MKTIETPESLIEFQERFRTDRACERYLFRWRWPDGFRCPRCLGGEASRLRTRPVYQCSACRRQTSVTAGTILHSSKVPLRKWFWAIFLVARHKSIVSALQLQNDLGIGSYRTAWLLLQKIRCSFGEGVSWPLRGVVEVDETLVGARNRGRPGKDPGDKAIVVGAVELRDKGRRHRHRWGDVRLRHVPNYTGKALGSFVRDSIERGTTLLTDGWRAYDHLACEGYRRETDPSSHYSRTELRAQSPMPHVHLLFSNLKAWVVGTFHGVSQKYLPRYLREFEYRVNRRRDPKGLFGWLVRRLTHHHPQPLKVIMAAEPCA